MERLLYAPRALPDLRPDVSEDPTSYTSWVRLNEGRRSADHEVHPLTLVMPLSGEPPPELIATIQSLGRQNSRQWTLLVVVESAWRTALTAMFTVSGLRRSSQHVRTIIADDPIHRGEKFSMAVAASQGSDLALIFPGDVWAPTAVATLSTALEPGTVVYADEDHITESGAYVSPRLKPAYSPEFLLHTFYTGRPMAIGGDVVSRLPQVEKIAPDAFEHDLALRAMEVAKQVVHVPSVLCHRSSESDAKADSPTPDVRHIVNALRRRADSGSVEPLMHNGTFRIRRSISQLPSLSIIIPFRDEPRFLRTCVDSIESTAGEQSFELILVDNGSVQPETATLMERLRARTNTRVLTDDRPFNWAALNNMAALHARGDVILFLNNDVEAHKFGWLEALCVQAMRQDIGAVGARLLYPTRRLQHCGVVVGLGGAAGHLFVGLDEDRPGYLNMAVTTRECAAVTGACLATRRMVFEALGGFDESLGVDLNDIDYCLRVQRQGLRVLYEPEAELIHHESPSRGTAGDVRDIVRFIDRWVATIEQGDPYLNRNLTRVDSSCALRDPGEEDWWQQWRSSLNRPM